MKRIGALLFFLLIGGCEHAAKKQAATVSSPEALVTNVKQLTFEGPRSGEGYFSVDGRQMVFQAEREAGNPFYQIYLRDLETGVTKRVSNGQGKTTCAWIHPSNQKVMFSSTHQDRDWRKKAKEQIETRQKGQREKYSWSYDDQYDIYEADLKRPGTYKALAPAKGYDAEGSYSPDGQWIAFASNRHAYAETLSPEDTKRRDEDPSYFLEIYLMRTDGTGLRRLTHAPGYDGGPFFSPDGQSLVWRRFTPDGHQADVWSMRIDSGEQKQLTRFQAMSWAPFFHPSGDYVIFTSNKLGYDNFELYMVDREGKKDPVRVTERPGFDGLPVFTPDGKRLSWTQRGEKGESQIHMGDWNDALARKLLQLPSRLQAPGLGDPALNEKDARTWIEYLASPEMKGRQSGSDEEKQYTQAIAKQFARLGMKPVVKEGFQQTFEFQSGVRLKEGDLNTLTVATAGKSESFQVNRDWAPLSFSASGEFPAAEIVDAKFGIVAPATDKLAAYDSYQNLDVKGRWVLAKKDLPEDVSNEQRFHLNIYAKLQHKALVARQAGAIGLLVEIPNAQEVQLKFDGADAGVTSIPVIAVTTKTAKALIQTGAKVSSKIAIEPVRSKAINVLAQIVVPGAKSTVMIGAHGDHLGLGEAGNSLAKREEKGHAHLGADDNASGVAAVMELAHDFENQVRSGKLKPKTNLAFAIWSAEEVGVLGSTHFVSTGAANIKAYLNLDMVGRLRDALVVQGTGSAKEWGPMVEPLSSTAGIAITTQADPYLPTDAMAFYLKKVPSLSFFTGAHSEYHSPRDVPALINYPGLVSVARVVGDLATELAASAAPLTYQKVEGRDPSKGGRGFRLYLGTIPDYSQDGIKGVRISGTTKASPAEKAGLREGDVIVELGGTKIENIQDYVYCLQSMKANEKTPLRVMRSGQVVQLEIVPSLKGM